MLRPDEKYMSAEDVLRDTDLSLNEIIKVLNNRKNVIIQHLESEDQNMFSKRALSTESETLKAIDRAINDLNSLIQRLLV